MRWEINQKVDIKRGAQGVQVWPNALMILGDNEAHVWKIKILDNGEDVVVSGTVTGYFVRPDGNTVMVLGTLEGNVASVVLPQAVYAKKGNVQGLVRLSYGGGQIVTLSALILPIRQILTDSIIDPGEVIPSLNNLLAQIAEMEEATARANAAGFNLRGNYNPDADPLYAEHDTVYFNGGSFVYINDTPSNEPTSSASHWQQIAAQGMIGPSAYDAAVAGGYTGTEAEFNAANAGIEAVKDAVLNAVFRYPYEKVLLYYGYPIAINGAWSVEGAVSLYASYDICVLGDTYQDPSHDMYADTLAICTRLKQVSPKTKIVGYVPIGMDPAWPDSNLTMAQMKQRVEQWIVLGASGIFLDEFGYDYYVTRARQNEIVSYCHDLGLFVFANSWSTEYVFNPNAMTIDWIPGFEPNPNGVAPVINENDYYLYENLFYTTRNLGTSENPNYEVTCANVWRLDDILRYFNEARINGESYYTHYGTKLCSLDAIPSTFNAEDRMVLRSLSAIGAAILNIHAVAFGDQNWGASGYFEHWDLPVNLNLYSEGIHSVSVETRSYTPEGGEPSTFPYKWTATLGGQSWSIVFDIDTPDDVAYAYRKRYAALNGDEVINAWTTIFSFQSDVQTAVESAAQAVATCEALVAEAEDVLPTVTAQIEQLNGVISGGQSDIGALLSTGQQNINSAVSAAQQAVSNANSALAAGIADLEMLSSGFNFKEVMW